MSIASGLTTFCPQTGERICDALASGRALRDVCTDAGMPGEATVYRWLREDGGFCDRYKLARMAQADGLLDEIIALADECTETVARSRLQVETRKWALARLAPTKYHDRALEAQATAAAQAPSAISLMTSEQRQARIAELYKKWLAGQSEPPT